MIRFLVILFLKSLFGLNAQSYDQPVFGSRINMGEIENNKIDEASGLAASIKNPGVLWTHNDSGGKNRIFAFDSSGKNLGEFFISGITNRDWEDITLGPGPDDSKTYLYIGDIGDNSAQYLFKYIYRIEEPSVDLNQNGIISTISDVDVITFYYPDGERDAETLMIDPILKDLFIVGKRDSDVRLYKLPYPHSTTNNFEVELAATLLLANDPETNTPNNYLTAGDISFDGTEIILKSYSNIYYWKRDAGVSIAESMLSVPVILPYSIEPQGEAICWANNSNNGYYTLSEENISINGTSFTFPAQLYYYQREIPTFVNNNKKILDKVSLAQNYPNPFNPTTIIRYEIPQIEQLAGLSYNVKLYIYDITGNKISTLVNKSQTPGIYKIEFDAKELSSGIYFYNLSFNNVSKTRKMVLIR